VDYSFSLLLFFMATALGAFPLLVVCSPGLDG
jgi:hypothetical protein